MLDDKTAPDESQRRIDALMRAGSVRGAARLLGLHHTSLRKWYERRNIAHVNPTHVVTDGGAESLQTSGQRVEVVTREIDAPEMVAMRRSLARSQAQVKALNDEIKAHTKRENLADDVLAFLAPVLDASVVPKPRKRQAAKRDGTPIIFVWHLTDLHWGEIVEPESVQYANAYSPGIAARRLQHMVDTIMELAETYSPQHYVEEIVLVVNGDTVGGSIHPDSAEYYARIVKQCLDASMVLAQLTGELAERFPKVRYLGTVGNHPRSTNRMPTGSARIATSWERMIHEMTAAMLGRFDNISYSLAQGYTIDAYIGPSRWAFSHGDATKGGGGQLGIPAYGLKRQHDANREWSIVMAQMTEAAIGNTIVQHTRTGHFHTYFFWHAGAADISLCPSPKGTDSFVKDVLGKYCRASMLLEVVHPKHDVIAHHLVNLQHVMSEESDCRYRWAALESDQPVARL